VILRLQDHAKTVNGERTADSFILPSQNRTHKTQIAARNSDPDIGLSVSGNGFGLRKLEPNGGRINTGFDYQISFKTFGGSGENQINTWEDFLKSLIGFAGEQGAPTPRIAANRRITALSNRQRIQLTDDCQTLRRSLPLLLLLESLPKERTGHFRRTQRHPTLRQQQNA
jgi:hypothetical protein